MGPAFDPVLDSLSSSPADAFLLSLRPAVCQEPSRCDPDAARFLEGIVLHVSTTGKPGGKSGAAAVDLPDPGSGRSLKARDAVRGDSGA